MSFKKNDNMSLLAASVDEKFHNSKVQIKDKIMSSNSNYEEKDEETKGGTEHETVSPYDNNFFKNVLELKSSSKDLQYKRQRSLTIRISNDSYEKLSYFTNSGMISQSDLFQALLEEYYKNITENGEK